MATPLFDLCALYQAADIEREERGMSWAAVSRKVGVAVSTIRRYATADDAEADGVLAVIRWLDVAPEQFVTRGAPFGDRLPSAGAGCIRVDMDLVAEASGGRNRERRTRTTIQNLVAVSTRSGQPVAALTRLSEV